MRDIIEAGILLTNPADFAGLNEEYARWFPSEPPTRYVAKLGVELPGLLVSIQMTAFITRTPAGARSSLIGRPTRPAPAPWRMGTGCRWRIYRTRGAQTRHIRLTRSAVPGGGHLPLPRHGASPERRASRRDGAALRVPGGTRRGCLCRLWLGRGAGG